MELILHLRSKFVLKQHVIVRRKHVFDTATVLEQSVNNWSTEYRIEARKLSLIFQVHPNPLAELNEDDKI